MIATQTVFAKELISKSRISMLKKMKKNASYGILEIFSKSPWLSSLYYSTLSPAFRRECQSVIRGKLEYFKELENLKDTNSLVRRNIHRLEKGLLMRPRREIFAKDFIGETVEVYKNFLSANSNSIDNHELIWAHDVLKKYFEVVGSEPYIDKLRIQFESLPIISDTCKHIPYKRDVFSSVGISYEQFLALSYKRRSVRWYLQKPVPRHLLDQAIEAALLAPSACNRQPFEFRVFDNPEIIQKLGSLPMGTKGFSQNFQVLIVVVGQLRAYFDERDRHIIYIDSSLASMALMYALETLGLSSCPINWPDVEPLEKQMEEALGLKLDERVIMLMSVGYPDPEGMVAYSQKKPLNQIRSYNRSPMDKTPCDISND